MSVRTGMVSLIAELRGLTDTALNQYQVGGVDYWTGEHLQDVLDLYAQDLNDVLLSATPLIYSGAYQFRRFYLPKGIPKWLESDTIQLINDSGYTFTIPYSHSPAKGLFEFQSNVASGVAYIRATSYNMYMAAAHVWDMKAAHTVQLVEFRAGTTQIKENQEHEHCLKMARFFKSKAGMRSIMLNRSGYGP